MIQTRLGSFYEACMNIVIGFSINWVANMAILPLFGFNGRFARSGAQPPEALWSAMRRSSEEATLA